MSIIAIDIGGTSLRAGIVERGGGLSAFEKHSQQEILEGSTLENLERFIRGYMERCGASVTGISLALPGTIAKDKATVLSVPNVKGFDGVNLKSYLNDRFNIPVCLVKDVNALLSFDIERFDITGVAVACYVGTGLGNAIYIDGKIYEGHNGSAGELGHIPVHGFTDICTCGNRGCTELLVAGKYLDAVQPVHFPETPINRIFEHASHPVLAEYVEHLAAVIATEINILDPETVILGGGVISMDGFPRERLEEQMRLYARKPYPERGLKFIYSNNNGENGVIGAGLYAWKIM